MEQHKVNQSMTTTSLQAADGPTECTILMLFQPPLYPEEFFISLLLTSLALSVFSEQQNTLPPVGFQHRQGTLRTRLVDATVNAAVASQCHTPTASELPTFGSREGTYEETTGIPC